jgi:hypothetical protein
MNRRTFLQLVPIVANLPTILWHAIKQGTIALDDVNELICKKKFDLAISHQLRTKPINKVIVEIAKSFLGVEYASDTLEAIGEERLIINLQALDCVTFYENSLVLARCIKNDTMTFDDYKKELQFVRYRGGIINGYPSRLHYSTDYFYDNEKKCVLKDITKEIGGVPYKKTVNFMSTHPESYPRLKESPGFMKAIKEIEGEISARSIYHIPKANVEKVKTKIKDGDIIGITTFIDGLDCSHTGIAIWRKGKLRLMHAPVPAQKVQITNTALWEYLEKNKKQAGIIVVRPLEPKV